MREREEASGSEESSSPGSQEKKNGGSFQKATFREPKRGPGAKS